MFDDKGGMRIEAGKSDLRNKLQVELSTRFVPEPDAVADPDGGAVGAPPPPVQGPKKQKNDDISSTPTASTKDYPDCKRKQSTDYWYNKG